MSAATDSRSTELDFDHRAEEYACHRKVHPGVIEALVGSGLYGAESRVLDVGCGTGNYAAALTAVTSCRISGLDPSARMLHRARDAARWELLLRGSAKNLPFANHSFDVVMTTDVIHHMNDRNAYFQEAARVVIPGGHIVTVTDSHDDLPRRRPLSSHFPETVEVELRRYPPVPLLLTELARAGFGAFRRNQVEHEYDLVNIRAYRDRASSSIKWSEENAFRRGIARLEADLARESISCISLYTVIWATLPARHEEAREHQW